MSAEAKSTTEWRDSRLQAGGALIEAYPTQEPGIFAALVHINGELTVDQGAAAIEAIMAKLTEQVRTPEQVAEVVAQVQKAIVARVSQSPSQESQR